MDPRLVKTSAATVGIATTNQAIANINARAINLTQTLNAQELAKQGLAHVTDPNSIVGALLRRQHIKNYLPQEPAVGFRCFRSHVSHLNLLDTQGKRVLFDNHFLVTDDKLAIIECEDAIKHARNVVEYFGPWASTPTEAEVIAADHEMMEQHTQTEEGQTQTSQPNTLVPTKLMPQTQSILSALLTKKS